MIFRAGFLGLCGALLAAAPARAETATISLSAERIEIHSNFTGATQVVFGVIDGAKAAPYELDYDVAITVRGPRGAVTVRRKERAGPLWLNMEQRKYLAIPAFIAALSNRPLNEAASEEAQREWRLGVGPLVPAQADRARASDTQEPDFRSALIRIRTRQGLFSEQSTGVRFLSPTVFRADVPIPGAAPLGAYVVEAAVLARGRRIATASQSFTVAKGGVEDKIARAAHQEPWLYGLFTLAAALFMGWIASQIFRRD